MAMTFPAGFRFSNVFICGDPECSYSNDGCLVSRSLWCNPCFINKFDPSLTKKWLLDCCKINLEVPTRFCFLHLSTRLAHSFCIPNCSWIINSQDISSVSLNSGHKHDQQFQELTLLKASQILLYLWSQNPNLNVGTPPLHSWVWQTKATQCVHYTIIDFLQSFLLQKLYDGPDFNTYKIHTFVDMYCIVNDLKKSNI